MPSSLGLVFVELDGLVQHSARSSSSSDVPHRKTCPRSGPSDILLLSKLVARLAASRFTHRDRCHHQQKAIQSP
jgi:hypothetical protein